MLFNNKYFNKIINILTNNKNTSTFSIFFYFFFVKSFNVVYRAIEGSIAWYRVNAV
jgi:hypothetical protein